MHCPLCETSSFQALDVTARPPGLLWHCQECDLIFKDPALRPDQVQEKARYDEHINGGEGHRRFFDPVRETLRNLPIAPQSKGLDWGSGPEPVLRDLLKADGIEVQIYDPFFGPPLPTEELFDFITLTEVIEHFFQPARDLRQIFSFLKPNGFLIVMTDSIPPAWWELSTSEQVKWLGAWAYRRDPTHVSFFSERSLRNLERLFHFSMISHEGRVSVFQKRADQAE